MTSAAFVLSLMAALPLPAAATAPAVPKLHGHYLEARTADVYGSACSTGAPGNEVVEADAGREAILAWHVEHGTWEGVDLAGLSVVVIVRSAHPLSDAGRADGGQSMILVDDTADAEQRKSLEGLARRAAAHLLGEVVAVDAAAIQVAVDPSRSLARLRAGQLAELSTRPFNRLDALCGDERVTSPPLVSGVAATPAVTLQNAFHGHSLGAPWEASNRRGAFVGTFDL
jgi:hypothetical protein